MTKNSCKYRKRCIDYIKNKKLCYDEGWVYCLTFRRLNKKEKEQNGKSW